MFSILKKIDPFDKLRVNPEQDRRIEKAKEWFWLFLNIALVVVSITGLAGIVALHRFGSSLPPARIIYVNAEGKTTVTPNLASLSFSVVTEGKDPEKISQENIQKMNTAIEYIKNQGIPTPDIKTAGYDLSPRYEYDETQRKSFVTGYTLTQTVFVKIRDFSRIGKVLGALPQLGVNQVSGLNFEVENPDQYLNIARQEAFTKALAKAKAMAKQNNVHIERVVTFSESQGGYPYPFRYDTMSAKGGGTMEAAPPQIEPGSQEVTVNVSVTYEID